MVTRVRRICADWSVEHAGECMGSELVATRIAREGDVILQVHDHSMDPVFPAGSCVIVDPEVDKPYLGEHVATDVAGTRLLRRFERRGAELRLVTENRSYGSQGVHIDGRDDVRGLGVGGGEYRTYLTRGSRP
jgi:SOS-response transcriptional repressor LexA